ncbi:hypothetical protein PPF1_57 [Rhizobium phage vB_RleM_PPF1]|uniref:hypothetical protein n=1 Tax=Rhizobium phage vB_RleM_PPF1 TaxID=1498228 RepID=UPI00049A5643|nr:hypothetical protein PPF1_57 [Rhizobium phage vB_RleM_PPF1]AID18370.1 hypothetical protein PPF1_57 [Rhizobium phage vB_RleM_PPF1]
MTAPIRKLSGRSLLLAQRQRAITLPAKIVTMRRVVAGDHGGVADRPFSLPAVSMFVAVLREQGRC